MKILAIDLAFSGQTGYCHYDGNEDIILDIGTFKPKIPKKGRAIKVGMQCHQIFVFAKSLCEKFEFEYIAYEITDWHQSKQKQERVVQAALGRAEGSFSSGIIEHSDILPWRIGANEAKSEFGASSKVDVAKLLSYQFGSLGWDASKKKCIWNGRLLSHDETDAIAIAYVFSKKMRLKELIEQSETPFNGEPTPPPRNQTEKSRYGL